MATDLVSSSLVAEEARPPPLKKRRRLVSGWDVPDPALLAHATRLQCDVASQLLQVYPTLFFTQDTGPSSSSCGIKAKDGDAASNSESGPSHLKSAHEKSTSEPKPVPPLYDDEAGHLNHAIGNSLTSRYEILQKIGEGTFGRVFECWDRVAQELVAIKVVRSIKKYREDAMVELEMLCALGEKDEAGSRGKAQTYFKHGRKLDWPSRYASRESLRAVHRLPRIKDMVAKYAGESSSLFADLLEGLLKYDSRERLTAKKALEHPFFRCSG